MRCWSLNPSLHFQQGPTQESRRPKASTGDSRGKSNSKASSWLQITVAETRKGGPGPEGDNRPRQRQQQSLLSTANDKSRETQRRAGPRQPRAKKGRAPKATTAATSEPPVDCKSQQHRHAKQGRAPKATTAAKATAEPPPEGRAPKVTTAARATAGGAGPDNCGKSNSRASYRLQITLAQTRKEGPGPKDALGRWLSFVCLRYCYLHSIGGSAVALAAMTLWVVGDSAVALVVIDSLGRRLSFACLCHCDLHSIGSSAVVLAAMDAFGRAALVCVCVCVYVRRLPSPNIIHSHHSRNITHSTSHTQHHTLNITHSISHTHTHNNTRKKSHSQHHTINITHPTLFTRITAATSHTQHHTLNITHPTLFTRITAAASHTQHRTHNITSNITPPTSHTQHHTLNITHRTSRIQHHTPNITHPTFFIRIKAATSHTQHRTLNITHLTSHTWVYLGSLLSLCYMMQTWENHTCGVIHCLNDGLSDMFEIPLVIHNKRASNLRKKKMYLAARQSGCLSVSARQPTRVSVIKKTNIKQRGPCQPHPHAHMLETARSGFCGFCSPSKTSAPVIWLGSYQAVL